MLDDINKQKKFYEKKVIIGFSITFIAFILFIPIMVSLGPAGFIVIVVPFFGGFLYAAKYTKLIKNMSTEFKKTFVEEEMKKVFPDSIYKPYDGFKEKEVVYSNLLFERDRYFSEDMIIGEFDGVNFRCSDVKQQEVRSNGKSTTVVTVFQGRFYEFDFHKYFKSELLLLQPFNFRPFSGFTKVKTESLNFNSELKIYTKDDHEAFYILTPDFMEKLVYFDKKYHDKISFSFKDNKLFIAINDRKDYFDFKMFKEVDMNFISTYKEEFEDIKDLIIKLNLSSTLFK